MGSQSRERLGAEIWLRQQGVWLPQRYSIAGQLGRVRQSLEPLNSWVSYGHYRQKASSSLLTIHPSFAAIRTIGLTPAAANAATASCIAASVRKERQHDRCLLCFNELGHPLTINVSMFCIHTHPWEIPVSYSQLGRVIPL